MRLGRYPFSIARIPGLAEEVWVRDLAVSMCCVLAWAKHVALKVPLCPANSRNGYQQMFREA